VIKEVPVEIIKEKIVNVIQEVVPNIDKIGDETQITELLLKIQQLENRPPEIIETIKEVQVEKIVEVEKSNDKTLLLQETLQKLRKELSLKNERIEELEKINKQLESIKVEQGAVYLKGSNISETM
jgi:predicted RNase H-like nuclease (RuvC/YqgF family)